MDTSIVRSGSAATAEVDGQLVALDIGKGVCYGLNHVATRIWQLIEQPKTPREVSQALLREFEVEPAMCEEQTLALLRDLKSAELAV